MLSGWHTMQETWGILSKSTKAMEDCQPKYTDETPDDIRSTSLQNVANICRNKINFLKQKYMWRITFYYTIKNGRAHLKKIYIFFVEDISMPNAVCSIHKRKL